MKKYFMEKDVLLVAVFVFLSMVVFQLPTGFEHQIETRAIQCKGVVLSTEDSNIQLMGMVKCGEQTVNLSLVNGPMKGQKFKAENTLLGQMDRDTIFSKGDTALVVLSLDKENRVVNVKAVSHYRLGVELTLLSLFAGILVCFGGWTGVKALVSFVFSALCIWKILVPCLLKGWDPILLTLGLTSALSGVIIFLVAGISAKGFTAFAGSFLGIAASSLMALFFTSRFHLNGVVMPFAETLLYSGFGHLNLTKIYTASIFLACSGAVMDIAMDVAASMNEVYENTPDITVAALVKSGLNVGRVVTGTMTTTLLFAYSGGFVTLLMAFMAQGVPLTNTFNLIYVASEILKTLCGSFGLVTVAPFTALAGGVILTRKRARAILKVTSSVSGEKESLALP